MAQKIVSIGFDIPGHSHLFHPHSSEQSLLDADIIVFEPGLQGYIRDKDYQGKVCLNADSSFKFKEATDHWRSELSTALTNGKSVFVMFGRYEEIVVHTGNQTFSGTGRNMRTTNIVEIKTNYDFFPVKIPEIMGKGGSEIRFTGNQLFATFWSEFADSFKYESYFHEKVENPLFLTKTGDKTIGALFRIGKGNLVLLPPIRFSEEDFTEENKKGQQLWNKKGIQFGSRLVQQLVDLDRALRNEVEMSPPPDWVGKKQFELSTAANIQQQILGVTKRIDTLTTQMNGLQQDLFNEEILKGLLFEKGKPLENAVIEGLRILEYKAENYDDGGLELDQVILSPEGERFIGEVEGKIRRQLISINLDSLNQIFRKTFRETKWISLR